METITFHFHSNDGFFSKLIEWRTGSRIAHVSIEVRGNHYNAYPESRFYSTTEKGVDVIESYSIEVAEEVASEAQCLLDERLGQLYDYKALFGFTFNKRKHSKGRVFCSEIANTILELSVPGEVIYKRLITPDTVRIAIIYYLKGIEVKEQEVWNALKTV